MLLKIKKAESLDFRIMLIPQPACITANKSLNQIVALNYMTGFDHIIAIDAMGGDNSPNKIVEGISLF